jgi:anti-sigma-K factor RskA
MADDHLLVGAYALGALDRSEALAFEAHLTHCPACRTEVAELTETAARMAVAVPAPVSQGLFDRVMEQVRVTPQLPRLLPGQTDGRADPPPGPPAGPQPTGGRVVHLPSRGPARGRAGRRLVSAAAVVVLAVLAGTLATRLVAEKSRQDELAAIVADPGGRHVQLLGGGAGEVSVHVQPASGRAVIDGRGLPGLDPARTYELWFMDGYRPVRALTFSPDESGSTRVAFDAPVARPDAFGVTVEPAGGRDVPTLPLVFQAFA